MKLIVTGATGFVGMEIIRQSLSNPSINSVVALARRPVTLPENASFVAADTSRLHSVILDDWTSPYSESVLDQLRGADACLWNLAITPGKSVDKDFAQVAKVVSDYTTNGLKNMASVANKPFRFIYTSGILAERNQSKELEYLSEYRHLRGRLETDLLTYAHQHAPSVQLTVAKPGILVGPGRDGNFVGPMSKLPRTHVSEVAAALTDQCVHGITKEPLDVGDLEEIGKSVLRQEDYVQ